MAVSEGGTNFFIYQAREFSLVPVGFSDSSVSEETVIYEAFVLMGEIGWCFSSLIFWRKGNV